MYKYNFKTINLAIRSFSTGGKNRVYTSDHQWVEWSDKDNKATVGITDHGRKQLKGKINTVYTPRVGQNYKNDDLLYVVSSDQFMVKFMNPISGTVTKINEKVIEQPELVNNDCENTGWLAIIETKSNDKDNKKLLSKKEYDEMTKRTK
ncbi:hypothetical protein DICPUDRAFT_92440 [Dictyostelium purpureum]|uniref:Lipoyl-binding domain-containing protein n=1 Tax=Dictyostelium purpureum TaxID=5786 RepID=F0ZRW3_DICPU|nr:uncharacterized protein DICPUDRAFT_92440 [Dictyostelium purpureum]EGC33300.1 hypothetical protein DICPUDRAFT_92440 [Dictyostelium purpureum]|eukprot:XP_003290156.1 hypothetical protein DICPUDRAFT_92440 [Dictyostelium purpureum]